MKREWTVKVNPTKYEDIKTYTILEPNPDAGKTGVCYSGDFFSVTTLDSKEDAQLIAASPMMYEALKEMLKSYERIRQEKPLLFNMLVESDYKLYHVCEDACILTEKALAKAEGK